VFALPFLCFFFFFFINIDMFYRNSMDDYSPRSLAAWRDENKGTVNLPT